MVFSLTDAIGDIQAGIAASAFILLAIGLVSSTELLPLLLALVARRLEVAAIDVEIVHLRAKADVRALIFIIRVLLLNRL